MANCTVQAESYQKCHPSIDLSQPQYIVGYGSLISENSKKKSAPSAGKNIPVTVTGYQRGWFLKGLPTANSITFLGIKSANNSEFNGVVFNLIDLQEIAIVDEREQGYCRFLIPLNHIQSLLTDNTLPSAQYWIYVPESNRIATANKQYPIVQSYVDVFLTGCIEIENKFHLQDYARRCISTTSDWSENWVNDRLYKRRPWAAVPDALFIDKILAEEVPEYFNQIQIE